MEFSRQKQLDEVSAARNEHDGTQALLSTAKRVQTSQWSHLEGLYDEVDKLTKGKSLMPTSDLLVESINSLITDTKDLVYRDTYLERIKLFVPAGDNPMYPDALISLRVLKQTLERFGALLRDEISKHETVGAQLDTIYAALQIAQADESEFYAGSETLEEDDEESAEGISAQESNDTAENEDTEDADESEEDDEDQYEEDTDENQQYYEFVTGSRIRTWLGKPVSEEWLRYEHEHHCFNFRRLDSTGVPRYLPPNEGITFLKVPNAGQ